MILLHDATSRYKSKKLYRQDPRYLKLWTEYAHWVEKPEEIFILLFQHGIGTELALLYEEYASLLETLERYDDAFRVYELGIESEAHPVRRLVRSYEESKKSLAERQRQGLLKQKEEDEARRRMYEMRANNRTLLGEKTDARSKTSFSANVFPNVQSNLGLPSRSSSTSFGNDRSSIPATSNSSSSASTSKISVYQDAESSSSSSSTSSRRTLSTLSQRNSASQKSASQFKRTGSLSSQFENRISAEKFEDVTIPQAETRYQTPTDSFKVHVDSKEQEPVRGLERNNSSLLSETSGEESRVSRLRKHPIEELEGTYVKRSRVDNRSETDIKHAKRMEDHFKRQRMLYLVNRDSKDREEVITVLKTTHSGTSFEEERAIALGIPYKEKPKDEEEEEEALSETNKVPEEDDVIIKAFSNIGWGKKWTSLSEAFVEGTKKDFQEIAQVLIEDDESNEEASASASREIDLNPMDAIRENLARINTVNFSSLRDGLTHTLNQNLPGQIQSVRLPENMDLAQLKEGLLNGTRSAEQYLQNFGTDVITALKNTVTVLEPEQEKELTTVTDINRSQSPRIFASRKEALISKMQTNENTYLADPVLSITTEQEKKVLETFNASFKIEEYTEEIAQLLNDYPELRSTMDNLVPVQVSYKLFWQRYFYHAWKIEQDEQKRQMIVQRVAEDEDEGDFKWDSDEEESKTITKKDMKQSSRTSEDTDEFSNISEPVDSPPLKSSQTTEDEWVKAEKKKSDDDDDSDSDWE
ncbi:Mad3/BUB1 homology region 1-domain-containing protein [Pilaira anomala]|nr:Mad3/BUB1 homology region 1-domain-containing protein [Pilaira anomala]